MHDRRADGKLENMARPRSITKRWLVRYPRGVPVAIFVLVAAITALSVFAIERGESQRMRHGNVVLIPDRRTLRRQRDCFQPRLTTAKHPKVEAEPL